MRFIEEKCTTTYFPDDFHPAMIKKVKGSQKTTFWNQNNRYLGVGSFDLDQSHIFHVTKDFYFKYMLILSNFLVGKFYRNIKQCNCYEHRQYEIFLEQQIFSEGSCDTEDWSNDAENTALHHRNK